MTLEPMARIELSTIPYAKTPHLDPLSGEPWLITTLPETKSFPH